MNPKFLTELETRDLDDKNFVLLSHLLYRSSILGGIMEAEEGFVSDGSSTPRIPVIFWLYGDRSHREGVIHDRLYRSPGHKIRILREDGTTVEISVSKNMADSVFKEAMEAREKAWYVKYGMWLGVKLGGFSSYRTGPERFKILTS